MKNSILLIAGAVITLLFLVLNTKIFEALFFERQFSNEMYNQNLYFVVALITVLVAWGLAAVFYYVVNSVSFSRWYHWLCVLGVACVAAPVASRLRASSSRPSWAASAWSTWLWKQCSSRWLRSPCAGGHLTVVILPYLNKTCDYSYFS